MACRRFLTGNAMGWRSGGAVQPVRGLLPMGGEMENRGPLYRGSLAARVVILLPFLAGSLFALSIPVHATDHFIRTGAMGANNGSDWNNAWSSFASVTWTRGDSYYVAGGIFTGDLTITRAASGSTWIYVKKATIAAHGTGIGWSDSYAQQTVINGRINIYSPYIDVDGMTGSENSGHGIKVVVQSCYAYPAVGILIDGNLGNVHVSHIEIQHCGEEIPYANDGVYNNNTIPTSGVHLRYLYIHDLSRNGITMTRNIGDTLIEHNRIERIFPGDPNIHGQAIQFTSAPMSDITVRFNQFVDIAGTAALALLGTNDAVYSNIYFYGNILWSTNKTRYTYSPAAVYGRDGTNSQVNVLSYNNTFFNVWNPNTWMMGNTVTNSENRNNIYVNCNFQFPNGIGNSTNPNPNSTNNFYYNNTGGNIPSAEVGKVNGTRSPFVNAPLDFQLSSTSEAVNRGLALSSTYAIDYAGVPRPQASAWDIGAFEYLDVAGPPPDTTPPAAPTGVRKQ